VSTSMPSITEPSGYILKPIREGADFTLYRGRQHGDPSPILAVALAAEQPSPQGLRRLEYEFSSSRIFPGSSYNSPSVLPPFDKILQTLTVESPHRNTKDRLCGQGTRTSGNEKSHQAKC
jgi:hypothetical protein